MKSYTSQFSLADFLAYLFPGYVFLGAIICILVSFNIIKISEVNIFVGFVSLAFAYSLGVLASRSVFYIIKINKSLLAKIENPMQNKYLIDMKNEIRGAFNKCFNKDLGEDKFTVNHFYLIRSFVLHHSLKIYLISDRQNSLYQIRKNLVIPVVFWGIAGLVKICVHYCAKPLNNLNNTEVFVLIVLILLDLSITIWIIQSFIKNMMRNRAYEVRNYCHEFVILSNEKKLANND